MKIRNIAILLLLTLAAAACGGTSDSAQSSTTAAASTTGDDIVTNAADAAEAAQANSGGGSATLTIGDQSWTFEPLACAFGADESGQEGTELVVSSIQDGVQMYFSIDNFGHSASLFDSSNFANPSVSFDSTGPFTEITVDGRSFSGTGEFLDDTSDSFERVPGTFSGTSA